MTLQAHAVSVGTASGRTVRLAVVAASILLVTPFVTPFATPASAVLTYGEPGRLLGTPSGAYAGSGNQYVGDFGAFLATAIGPNHVLTAAHVGGHTAFRLDGVAYPAVAFTDVPDSDLRVWRVDGTLPRFAPLWDVATDGPLPGREMVLFGRSGARGRPVYVYPADPPVTTDPPVPPAPVADLDDGFAPPPRLVGWTHGAYDGLRSWGTNRVDRTFDAGDDVGRLLSFSFTGTPDRTPFEATVAPFDSGGGVFVRSAHSTADASQAVWKLAGVHYAIDGPFRLDADGDDFGVAAFDARGLYVNSPDGWGRIDFAPHASAVPTSGYATDVSAYVSALRTLTGVGGGGSTPGTVPEPASCFATAAACAAWALRRRRDAGVTQA